MNLYQELKKLTKPQCVEFAIIKAESVIYLIEDDELKALAKDCIDCAKAWLQNPTEENRKKCRNARNAVYGAAAYAACAAYADDDTAAAAADYAAADAARAKSNQENLDLIEKIKAQEQDA